MLISFRDPRSSFLYDCDRFVSRLCGQGGFVKGFFMFGACERFLVSNSLQLIIPRKDKSLAKMREISLSKSSDLIPHNLICERDR